MKFTVLIPLYNKAAFIGCTLDSVLAQSCQDFEILVVDDGSCDGGDQVLAQVRDSRLRLVRQANAGVSAARNRGIREARGDWVVFLDADDWLHPEFLAGLVHAQKCCPQAQIVATDFLRCPHTDTDWPPRWQLPAGKPDVERITDLPLRWIHGPTFCCSSVAVRRSTLQAMQPCFPVGESVGEDLDLWFRLAEQSPLALVRSPLAAYRVELPGSLSAQARPTTIPPFMQRMRQRALSGQLTPQQSRSTLRLVAQQHITLARQAIGAGQRGMSLRWLMLGRDACWSQRWWVTLTMALLFPARWVSRWQHWRVRRASPSPRFDPPETSTVMP